jgi:unsaturated chondroitin disaccharide hydrolase
MLKIDYELQASDLQPAIDRLWQLSASKILEIEKSSDSYSGAPVFTAAGLYTSRGWTEWTQGFQFGSAILQFDATGDARFLELGRKRTLDCMAGHLTHAGVHDHGFNNISTYGNLLRLSQENRFESCAWEPRFYALALASSGATQARRWTSLPDGDGYIYSFNGPHSLFIDTIRTLRVLVLAHQLGHCLMGENDRRISLLERAIQHARTTARYGVYYGEGRDGYDIRGRVAHESIFNVNDGKYRCPSSQQGYSPFTTWTRGLAWAVCGFAELLEFFGSEDSAELEPAARDEVLAFLLRAARAVCDFYIQCVPTDGVPYWDTGAPGLAPADLDVPSDPYNDREPVDSSAAAIAAQGLLRMGTYLEQKGSVAESLTFRQAGLTVLRTLLAPPYLSEDEGHQGLLLHSVYHRPNGWDYVPEGRRIPCGESTMWGDYHFRELALYVQRIDRGDPYLSFALKGGRP